MTGDRELKVVRSCYFLWEVVPVGSGDGGKKWRFSVVRSAWRYWVSHWVRQPRDSACGNSGGHSGPQRSVHGRVYIYIKRKEYGLCESRFERRPFQSRGHSTDIALVLKDPSCWPLNGLQGIDVFGSMGFPCCQAAFIQGEVGLMLYIHCLWLRLHWSSGFFQAGQGRVHFALAVLIWPKVIFADTERHI